MADDDSGGFALGIASGKGGVGKTTTAVNLGASFVDAGLDVVIVDVDFGMANLGTFVGLTNPNATIHHVLNGEVGIDEACHKGGGLTIVPGATDLERFASVDAGGIDDVVQTLSERYDVVLLDAGAGLNHEVAVSLETADGVLLVTTADLASLTDAAKTGELVERLDVPVVGATFTRTGDGAYGDVEGIATALGTTNTVTVSVPYDRAVPRSIRNGVPVVVADPDSPASRAYGRLATRLGKLLDLENASGVRTADEFDWVDPESGTDAVASDSFDTGVESSPLEELIAAAGLDDGEAATRERVDLLDRVWSRLT